MQRLGSVPQRLRVKIISEKEVERMQILTTLNSSNELHENKPDSLCEEPNHLGKSSGISRRVSQCEFTPQIFENHLHD